MTILKSLSLIFLYERLPCLSGMCSNDDDDDDDDYTLNSVTATLIAQTTVR